MLRYLPVAAVAAVVAVAAPARAEVKLPAVLSSHMVLQRDKPVPIWGTAASGEKVTVKFRDQTQTATAGADGKWSVQLTALKAGGPDKLTVTGTNVIELDDVLVGEVWVGSGQSNMAGAVQGYAKNDPVLAKLATASYPKIRLLKSAGKWQETTPQTAGPFSAILFAFGVRLQQALDVPVGLMVGAVGGTPSGYWLTEDMLKADAPSQAVIAEAAKTYDPEKAKKAYEVALARWEKDTAAAKKNNTTPLPRKPLAPAAPGQSPGKIGNLYDAHIRPMVPYGIRGVLWDQGEAGTQVTGVDQFTLMGALIKGWRGAWGQDFPFIYVQKISGGGCAWDYTNPVTDQAEKFVQLPATVPPTADGLYRELHIKIMKHPNTYMAISTDLGPMTHPTNKSGYGTRASQVALGAVYGQKVEYYGPMYKSHTIEGNKVRVTFTHTTGGLAVRHTDKLQGFAVAGEDKVFHWADATIDGDSVIVSSEKVAKPVAVRYGFAAKHPWANLFNGAQLPAVAFRTDDNK